MALPVAKTKQAERDLIEIMGYLEDHSPAKADAVARSMDKKCKLLSTFPELGRARPELAPGIRSVVIDRFVLFYRVSS